MCKKMVRPQFLLIVRQGGSPFPVRPASNSCADRLRTSRGISVSFVPSLPPAAENQA